MNNYSKNYFDFDKGIPRSNDEYSWNEVSLPTDHDAEDNTFQSSSQRIDIEDVEMTTTEY